MSQFPAGSPVRIYLSGAPRTAIANATALTLVDIDGVARTLTTKERLVIYWLDSTGLTGVTFRLADGVGTALPTNLLGAFSSLQVGLTHQPIVGRRGIMPKIYFPDSTDNTGTAVTFGYGEVIGGNGP